MIIGIPKEIKNNENRIALTPAGAQELVKRGHKVYVQASAGVNSGFADDDYIGVGAEMLPTIEEVYARAEMILKVKEPIAPRVQTHPPRPTGLHLFPFRQQRTPHAGHDRQRGRLLRL